MVADEDHAVQSLHELADIYRKHSAMVAMLIVPSVNFTDATVTCPGGKHRRRIGMCYDALLPARVMQLIMHYTNDA